MSQADLLNPLPDLRQPVPITRLQPDLNASELLAKLQTRTLGEIVGNLPRIAAPVLLSKTVSN